MSFGLYVGDEAITRTFPVSTSIATTAPQRLPSDWSATCWARAFSVSWRLFPSIVAPLSRSSVVSSTVERFAFEPVR